MKTSTHKLTKEGREAISRTQKARWARKRQLITQAALSANNHSPKRPSVSVDEDSYQRGVVFGYTLAKTGKAA